MVKLINIMCDLAQFFVSTIENGASLEMFEFFMQNIMIFCMTNEVVFDADSIFHHLFDKICTTIKITYRPLTRFNCKGLSIGKIINSSAKPKSSLVRI